MRPIHLVVSAAACVALRAQVGACQPPASERPTITVSTFDFGTVSTPVSGVYRGSRDGGEYQAAAFAEAIGTGAADLLVEKLVESARFRVYERKQLEAVTREQQLRVNDTDSIARARYLVTGSVSHLGMNDKDIGGVLAGVAGGMLFRGLGLIRTNRSSTTVRLTARIVDTRTGEILASFTGEGESKKRWGVNVIGAGRGGIGGINAADRNFRETAIGEATAHAVEAIAERVVALRATALQP